MTRILGIDPGSRVTGYGIIELQGRESRYVASGCVRMEQEEFPERLRAIFDALSRLVAEYQPNEVAIEKVFVQRNVDSALMLGLVCGVVLCVVLFLVLLVVVFVFLFFLLVL